MPSHSDALNDHVGAVTSHLQMSYLSDSPALFASASATLAKLRRAIGSSPGADPTVWEVMFADWPTELHSSSDDPTLDERAAHAALTLYSLHQQSKRQSRMHRGGRSLGLAVGELSRTMATPDAVRRRFDALSTAGSFREVLHHGRGLVTQLRGADISLDYGLLASHLRRLQRPQTADQIRLRWARDFYRRSPSAGPTPPSQPTSIEGESV